MRILQLGKFYPIRGGVEKAMWSITEGLSQQGIPCDMLCSKLRSDGIDAKDEQFIEGDNCLRLNPFGRIVFVPAIAKKAATMISPATIAWLGEHCSDYDIINIHHPDPMAALALRRSGYRGKVVLHWHSDILAQKFFLPMYKPLQNWLIRRADRIIGTSPVYLKDSPYLKDVQQKCRVVPIGIDGIRTDQAKCEEIRSRYPGKTLVFSMGRLVPYKGFSYLVDSFKELPEKFHLLLGGEGPLNQEIRAQIEENGLEGRITLLGYVPDEDLPSYFGACDMFVLSSVMKTEAFGIVQIEAMSCGKPIVATRIPGSGVPWVNEDGVSGRNAIPRDVSSLTKAILDVDADRENLGAGALKRFRTMFTKEMMLNNILKVYEELS